jgi:hypothetical protein
VTIIIRLIALVCQQKLHYNAFKSRNCLFTEDSMEQLLKTEELSNSIFSRNPSPDRSIQDLSGRVRYDYKTLTSFYEIDVGGK